MNSPKLPKVLVVDDDPINLQALVGLLDSHCQILVARNGEEALRRLERADPLPDLVLLDIQMPGMNGYEVCRTIKNNPVTTHLPIIFITAHTEVEQEVEGFESGGVDFIHKPFHETIVLARVKTHLELKQRGDQLARLASVDPLTGLANRRRFDQFLEFEWRRGIRHRSHLSLILMDVDHFKLYNDHYGHPQGDACLMAMAGVLRGVMHRSMDLSARYGGEEFVCVLPETDSEGALAVAERIRRAVEELAIPHARSLVADQVTLSLGVATMIPLSGELPQELVKRADNALYQAKQAGRNRVVLHVPTP